MPDKTPDEIWNETGDALAELERIGMEQIKSEPPGLIRQFSNPAEDTVNIYAAGESKTPAAALSGVELCERVLLALGYTRCTDGRSVWFEKDGPAQSPADDGKIIRFVEDAHEKWNRSYRRRFDLDGNHLAEVREECERRGWGWEHHMGHVRRHICTIADCQQIADSFPVAFLRAFVAASEAEKVVTQ